MGAVRRSRNERPTAKRYVVTERDIELLHALGRMKAATTRQLASLFFRHVSAATRRIGKLFALGLLCTHCTDLNSASIVTLTAKGARLLMERGTSASELHVVRRIDHRDGHLEAINDLRVGLVHAARSRLDVTLDLFLADHDLRRTLGRAASSVAYIPDALVRLVLPRGRELHVVVEVDLGTEWSTPLTEKIRTVHDIARTQAPVYGLAFPWRPVVLAPDLARAVAIARLITAEHGETFWALGLIDHVAADPCGDRYALASDLVGDSPAFRRRLVPLAEGVS